jgi:hypothetical protein
MNKLIALLYFVLTLVGFDVGGSTLEHRSEANGMEVLHSRTHVQAGVARFECVSSRTGLCHYVVLPRGCVPTADAAVRGGGCWSEPLASFVVPHGDSHQVTGLHAFRLCVSSGMQPSVDHCDA